MNALDLIVVGGGFTGLHTAISVAKIQPTWKMVVFERLEKGALASTQNAGFACFGSPGEILDDLEKMERSEVIDLIRRRFKGIQELKNYRGTEIEYNGGYEVFTPEEEVEYEKIKKALPRINQVVLESTGVESMFEQVDISHMEMAFLPKAFFNKSEFQLDPGYLHDLLLLECKNLGVRVIHGADVTEYDDVESNASVTVGEGVITTRNLAICTNALTPKLINDAVVKPARGQIITITKGVSNMIEGNFHGHKGFYYFRNYNDGLLLGGGRHINIEAEETTELKTTREIRNHLQGYAQEFILPGIAFEVDKKWSGIMAMGPTKSPVVKRISTNVYAAYAFGGMGVALSKSAALELSELILTR